MTFFDGPLKVLMGIGRAVYESTNKAIFADFFPGEKSAGAAEHFVRVSPRGSAWDRCVTV